MLSVNVRVSMNVQAKTTARTFVQMVRANNSCQYKLALNCDVFL